MRTLQEFIQDTKGETPMRKTKFDWDTTSAFPIPRSQMPQVGVDFVDKLEQLQIPFEIVTIVPSMYKPTQINFDEDKVNSFIEKMKVKNDPIMSSPVIVSNDSFVLDGHHRYIASVSSDIPIRVVQVDLNITDLLKLAQDLYE